MNSDLNLALRNAPNDAQIIADAEGRVVSWNRGAKEIFQYSISEVKGQPMEMLMPEKFHAEHKSQISQFKKTGTFKNSGRIIVMEGIKKDGQIFPAEVSLNVFEDDGEKFICGLIRDISERVELQEELNNNATLLKEIQGIANLGIWRWNVQENTVKWSDLLYDIYGLSREEFGSSYEGYLERVHPDDREIAQNTIGHALNHKVSVTFEERIIRPDGEVRYLRSWAGPALDEDGNVVRLIGACLDITERKTAENLLKKAFNEVSMLKRQLEDENYILREEIELEHNYEDLVYGSDSMRDVLHKVEQVANTDATVLIMGETGTGKELIARAIHNISSRSSRPLVKVNCAAIPKDLIESELFGHVKGAFTGATSDKIGKFELANEGTIFLDEIGELSIELQPKILRTLQEGEIEKVGGTADKKVNVRVIAATNKNLKVESDKGNFREDLYFRLNVFPIEIPPLRERIEDIPFLLEHFVNKYSKKHGKTISYISDEAMEYLQTYNWPGNIREFENLIERAIILSKEDSLFIPEVQTSSSKRLIDEKNITLDDVLRNHIKKVLRQTNWKIDGENGAAELLGLKPSTLRDRMKKLNIVRPSS